MPTLAELVVGLDVDLSKADKSLQSFQGKFKKASGQLKSAGATMQRNVTLPILAAAAGLTTLGAKFDGAVKTIRKGTGATGESLKALEQDFESALARVPEDIGTVSQAIADLNTRTGASGKPLQDLTVKFLDLARVAEEDVNETIRNGTRVFGDWSVATEDQSDAMDLLWKTSQQTGVGVNRLMGQLVQFGAPLRQMGFSLEESAALLGKWEKEGVNVEKILGALSMGAARFTKQGVDADEGLRDLIASMQELGPGAEASGLALEIFGSRASEDFATAVAEGRFELDEMLAALDASDETIGKASDDAKTFGQQWAEVRNQISLALKPLGEKLVAAFESLKPRLEGAVTFLADLVDRFAALPGPVQAAVGIFVALVAAVGPLLTVMALLAAAIAALMSPVGLVVVAIGGLIAALGAIGFAITQVIKDNEELRDTIIRIWDRLMALWEEYGDGILLTMKLAWEGIKKVIETTLKIVLGIVDAALSALQGDWSGAWAALERVAQAWKGATEGLLNAALQSFLGIFKGIKNVVVGVVVGMWEDVKRTFRVAIADITGKVEDFKNAVVAPFQKMKDVIVGNSIVPDMVSDVVAEFETMRGETEKKTSAMVAAIVSKFTDAQVAVKDLTDEGKRHIEGLIQQQAELAMTEEEFRRFQLRLQGVKEAEIETILEMERHIAATKANRDGVRDLITELERQANRLGVSTEKTIDQRIAELELTDAQRDRIDGLRDLITQEEFQAEALEAIEEMNQEAAKAEEAHAKAVEASKDRIEKKLKGVLNQTLPAWAKGWEEHWQLAKDVFAVFGEDIGSLLEGLLGKFGGWMGKLGDLFGGGLGGIFDKVKGFLGGVDDAFGGGFSSLFGKAKDLFGGLGGLFDKGFGGFLGKAKGFVGGFADKLLGGLGLGGGVFGSVSKLMTGPWGAAIMTGLDLLGIDMNEMIGKIAGVAMDGLKAVGGAIASAGGAILDGLGGIGDAIGGVFGGGSKRLGILRDKFGEANIREAVDELMRRGDVSDRYEGVAVLYEQLVRGGGGTAELQDLLGRAGSSMSSRAPSSSAYDPGYAAALRGAGASISRGMSAVNRTAASVSTPRVNVAPAVDRSGGSGDKVAILEVDREKLGRVVFKGGVSSGRRQAGIRET